MEIRLHIWSCINPLQLPALYCEDTNLALSEVGKGSIDVGKNRRNGFFFFCCFQLSWAQQNQDIPEPSRTLSVSKSRPRLLLIRAPLRSRARVNTRRRAKAASVSLLCSSCSSHWRLQKTNKKKKQIIFTHMVLQFPASNKVQHIECSADVEQTKRVVLGRCVHTELKIEGSAAGCFPPHSRAAVVFKDLETFQSSEVNSAQTTILLSWQWGKDKCAVMGKKKVHTVRTKVLCIRTKT